MPAPGSQNHMHTPRVRNGEPQPAAIQTPEPASAKRDLTSWWRQFSKRPAKKDEDKGTTSTAGAIAGWHGCIAAYSAAQTYLVRLKPALGPPALPPPSSLVCIH